MLQKLEVVLTMIAIVPNWLQEPLSVLLEASDDVEVLGSASSLEELPPVERNRAPDLLLIYTAGADDEAVLQIRTLKNRWPRTHVIALIEHARQRELLESAGANETIRKGVSPAKLLQTIQEAAK